jgi:hypothetical protein
MRDDRMIVSAKRGNDYLLRQNERVWVRARIL